ncbi:MAG: ACP phosphodiesterase [Vicinamibacterales bacterium]
MNFLAHLYLSGPEPDVVVGNFIGDFVKGREWTRRLRPDVARGVRLHRAIDAFTDRHPLVKQSQARLRPTYRHYASVIVDIYYDHYLAARWAEYSAEPLAVFADRAYRLLASEDETLPERARGMLPRMASANWLLAYAEVEGIARALHGMSRRARPGSRLDQAARDLTAHYSAFEAEFRGFFPELQAFAASWLQADRETPTASGGQATSTSPSKATTTVPTSCVAESAGSR